MEKGGTEEEEEEGKPIHLSCVALNFPSKGKAKKKRRKLLPRPPPPSLFPCLFSREGRKTFVPLALQQFRTCEGGSLSEKKYAFPPTETRGGRRERRNSSWNTQHPSIKSNGGVGLRQNFHPLYLFADGKDRGKVEKWRGEEGGPPPNLNLKFHFSSSSGAVLRLPGLRGKPII